jgi:hypothetical protein
MPADALADAIRDTFGRRRTPLPTASPDALSPGFSNDENKRRQWNAFRRTNRLERVQVTAINRVSPN